MSHLHRRLSLFGLVLALLSLLLSGCGRTAVEVAAPPTVAKTATPASGSTAPRPLVRTNAGPPPPPGFGGDRH